MLMLLVLNVIVMTFTTIRASIREGEIKMSERRFNKQLAMRRKS